MKSSLKSLLVTIALCVAGAVSPAQEMKSTFVDEFFLDPDLRSTLPSQHMHSPTSITFPAVQIDNSIDVISYELYLDWVMPLLTRVEERPLRKFEGHVVSMVQTNLPTDTIHWNARGLMIDSILIDGVLAAWTVENGVLAIIPVERIPPNDTVQVDAYYACLSDTRGFFAFADSDAVVLELLHPIAFTFSEPEDARRWYPCKDVPSDKALFTVHARVPKGFTVVSNGTRQDSTADTDTTSWQTWHHPDPMSTYLFSVNASVFRRYDLEHVGEKTIPITNYHWPEDQTGERFNAEKALVNVPNMFKALESRLGAYPWPTYGHVTVSPIQIGGMEHQSMTTVNRRWLVGDVENGYAHELGHQWLGDAVTCATWEDIWLNEGGASYTEALWREWKDGPDGYKAVLSQRRAKYLEKGLSEPPIYAIPITNLFNEGTTYCKSAWVYHMMRRLAGDEQFFSMFKSWVQSNKHQVRQTFEFLDHVTASIPTTAVAWDVFFDQWLVQAGHPVFVVYATTDGILQNGSFKTVVRLSQAQGSVDVPAVFITPLTVRLFGATEVRDTTIFVDTRDIEFSVSTSFVVDSCRLDPNSEVLCQQVVQFVSDVNEAELRNSVEITPIPVHRGLPLYISMPVQRKTSIVVNTVDGRTIYHAESNGGALQFDTSQWPIGVVSIVLESNGKTKATMVPVVD